MLNRSWRLVSSHHDRPDSGAPGANVDIDIDASCSKATEPVVLLTTPDVIGNLGVSSDGSLIFSDWNVAAGDDGGIAVSPSLRRILPDGSNLQILGEPPFIKGLRDQSLVRDQTIFFTVWAEFGGPFSMQIFSMPVTGGEPTLIATLPTSADLFDATLFAADADTLYFMTRVLEGTRLGATGIYRVSLHDGQISTIAEQAMEIERPQLVGDQIWFQQDGVLHTVPRSASSATPSQVPISTCYFPWVTAAHGVYCGDFGTLSHFDLDGTHETQLVGSASGAEIDPVASDDSALYFWAWESPDMRNLWKISLATNAIDLEACGRGNTSSMAISPTAIFWTEFSLDARTSSLIRLSR